MLRNLLKNFKNKMAKRQGEECYIVTNPVSNNDPEEDLLPVLWSKLPSEVFDVLPEYYMSTVAALNSSTGDINERTVVFLKKVSKKTFEKMKPEMIVSTVIPLSDGELYLGVEEETDDDIDFKFRV